MTAYEIARRRVDKFMVRQTWTAAYGRRFELEDLVIGAINEALEDQMARLVRHEAEYRELMRRINDNRVSPVTVPCQPKVEASEACLGWNGDEMDPEGERPANLFTDPVGWIIEAADEIGRRLDDEGREIK